MSRMPTPNISLASKFSETIIEPDRGQEEYLAVERLRLTPSAGKPTLKKGQHQCCLQIQVEVSAGGHLPKRPSEGIDHANQERTK